MTPNDMGGAPVTVPSNNWWDFGNKVLDAAIDYRKSKLSSVATPAGVVGTNVGTGNIPIGQAGLNVQAAATPGGSVQLAGGFALPSGLLWGAAAALVLAFVVIQMRRRG